MFFYNVFFSVVGLALGLTVVSALPSAEEIALARKYAPQFRFSPYELYFPSTIEFFLPFVKAVDAAGNPFPNAASPLTASNLASMHQSGTGSFLAVDDFQSHKATFLRGQKPGESDPVTYAFVVPKDNGVVDLFYWLFYPFNEAKSVPVLGQVGDHVGDWERLVVRTVNGVATQADYHAHSDTGSTLPWDQVPKFNNEDRPVAYIAKGSHGVWPTPAKNVYANALIFQLADATADEGVQWDSKDRVVPIRFPDTYSGDLAWVNYQGQWGNQGTTRCWWHPFVSECEVVDGPDGPLREAVFVLKKRNLISRPPLNSMRGPLSTTIAMLAIDSPVSLYTLRIDPASLEVPATHLAVEQRCKSSKLGFSFKPRSTTEYVPLDGWSNEFKVTVPACEESMYVHSYTVGLCSSMSLENCSWSSVRTLSTYLPNVTGIQRGPAVITDDLDNFFWS